MNLRTISKKAGSTIKRSKDLPQKAGRQTKKGISFLNKLKAEVVEGFKEGYEDRV